MRKLSVAINKNWQTAKFLRHRKKRKAEEKVSTWMKLCWYSEREKDSRSTWDIFECNRITLWEKFLIGLSLYNTCDCCSVYIKPDETCFNQKHIIYDSRFVDKKKFSPPSSQSSKKHQGELLWFQNFLANTNCKRPLKREQFMALEEREEKFPYSRCCNSSRHRRINSFIKNKISWQRNFLLSS